jgi:hypothetical protein
MVMRILIVILILASAPIAGRADEPRGEAHARARALELLHAGEVAIDDNQLPDAISALEAANRLVASPTIYFRLADAFQRARERERAASRLKACLHLQPALSEADRSELEQAIAALEEDDEGSPPIRSLHVRRLFAVAADLQPLPVLQPTRPAPSAVATPLARRWWLWTIVGVVATGAAVGIGVGLSSAPSTPTATTTLGTVKPF